jgi:gluconolactonase
LSAVPAERSVRRRHFSARLRIGGIPDFTNEIRFDANEEFLYVVETTGGRITRLRIDDCGEVTAREIFGPTNLGPGAWPDGIAFDSYGNLWGTLVYSDKLFVLTPEGDLRILLDEGDPAKVEPSSGRSPRIG